MNVEGCYSVQDENSGDDPHSGNIEDHDADVIMEIKKRIRKVS